MKVFVWLGEDGVIRFWEKDFWDAMVSNFFFFLLGAKRGVKIINGSPLGTCWG